MNYIPSTGGHAPGHLRDTLLEALDASRGKVQWWEALDGEEGLESFSEQARAALASMSAKERAAWLCGQLWNCTDTVPGDTCNSNGIPMGSTYAQAARLLRDSLN